MTYNYSFTDTSEHPSNDEPTTGVFSIRVSYNTTSGEINWIKWGDDLKEEDEIVWEV